MYAFVKNLFKDVANVVCTGQKAYPPVTLNKSCIDVLLQKLLLVISIIKISDFHKSEFWISIIRFMYIINSNYGYP